MTEEKRVCCLYRVSTKGQVEKDDIPMQKQCCRNFVAEHPGWKIVKELSEKGISGFKVSAKDRDAIVELQGDAAVGKFDILLVFMFDRLGRRDDETPFIVEWFVRNGIEVWSTVEGQQRFDNHVDKLMNYIRYWQASGESIKTSIRTKTRLGQIIQEGRFRGGTTPYGYRLEKQGRINKKSHEVNEILIDEEESAVVKLIFQKYVYEGYGAQRLSRYLLEQGIVNRKGMNFANTTIIKMLKNNMYLGILKSGESQSEIFPHLQIIDTDTYERAQEIMEKRTNQHSEVPLNCKGRALIVGLVYCGHCGTKLNLTTTGKDVQREDGSYSQRRRPRYQCHYKVRHPQICDGQSGYNVATIDSIVEKVIHKLLEEIKAAPQADIINQQIAERKKECEAHLNRAVKACKMCEKELADYRSEVLKIIRGESSLSADMLNGLVLESQNKLEEAQQQVVRWEQAGADKKQNTDKLQKLFGKVFTWSEMFASCNMDEKKMIVAQLIQKVTLYKNKKMEIEFNISIQQILDYQQKAVGKQALDAISA